jgi:hypothetical protein
MVGLQALAGEPVTLLITGVLAFCYAGVFASDPDSPHRIKRAVLAAAGMILGLLLAAIQLVPMVLAARMADRANGIVPDAWSLRPPALLEVVWLHLFGNFFETQSLAEVPWMRLMFDRE